MTEPLQHLDPVPTLLGRAAEFPSFRRGTPTRVSRAPGRLDVMGGIADYTGSLVCEKPIAQAAAVATQPIDGRRLEVYSLNLKDLGRPHAFGIDFDVLASSLGEVRAAPAADPAGEWAGYVAGCLHLLHAEGYVDLAAARGGLAVYLYSDVPFGAGVSSSAAVEVATMTNFAAGFGVPGVPGSAGTGGRPFTSLSLAKLCQDVENRVVRRPCGVMDQVSSCCGEAGQLLRLVCQPHELLPPLPLPAGLRVVGVNSHVKHQVAGGPYARTRCSAFMGLRMIDDHLRRQGQVQGANPLRGYLANLPVAAYEEYRPTLPDRINGAEFLGRFGPTLDTATTVDPALDYHVRPATDHHVYEADRVLRFCRAIEAGDVTTAGDLMFASHESYGTNALLGADECDVLVDLVRQRRGAGLHGAKITGGGSGGTVAVLADVGPAADAALAEVIAGYAERTGLNADVLAGSSPGAWRAGTAVVTSAS